jgi:hypothetical protein
LILSVSPEPVADRLLGILRQQTLELSLGLFMLEVCVPGADKDACEISPGIGGAHIDHANGLNPRFRRVEAEQGRELAALDTAPALLFRADNEVLMERRIGMGLDLDPFAAAV